MAAAQEPVLTGVLLALIAAGMSVLAACTLIGVARSSFYRITRGYQHYRPVTDPTPQARREQPAALSHTERDTIIDLLGCEEYMDLSVLQAYWRAFDAKNIGCSLSTFYRVARSEKLTGDRRRIRRGASSKRVKPVVPAAAPNELWTWDTTELRGPRNQDRYRLGLIVDVYSRYPVGWYIGYSENAADAKNMFTAALTAHGAPAIVHSDNGAAMRASELTSLLENIPHRATMSYSRPRVSDDNPFSESMFKTLKYDLNCPDHFDSIEHAREWTGQYLHTYAHQHRHSGLNWHTPASVYHSTAHHVQHQRQQHLDQYYAAHPKRFRQPPQAPRLPEATGINIKPPHLSQTG
ncbi:IS3 family transposase [Hoyosella altamirensis]|uniref:Transposase InsO family protein n=1 Tax=Hoyosella altamirensis TaxID=616997 RepID=A0A839RJG7_9ACTN|nr:IS3 family transposase [Hoyosella altamirensis]MBB3035816.1 transposase InsO family protein [Hoyosella altamirensis]MBB3036972.1 transposase InsO family protein [Hoyosella altamirensis]MBB3038246.1 transposase InsO family protein [Hoyosella altamirensis]